MPTSRRTVARLARQAGGRPVSRYARADLADALEELDHLATEVIANEPPAQVDAFLTDLEALTADVERIFTRGRR